MKKLLFLLIIFTGNTFACDNSTVKNGLYFGQRGGFSPPIHAYLYITHEGATIEIYQALKGEINTVLTEPLIIKKSTDAPVIFLGKKIAVLCKENTLYIESIVPDLRLGKKSIPLSLRPDKANELNTTRNRAYLFIDSDIAPTEVLQNLGHDKNRYLKNIQKEKYTQLELDRIAWHQVRAAFINDKKRMAMYRQTTLPHDEFANKYKQIRQEIITELCKP